MTDCTLEDASQVNITKSSMQMVNIVYSRRRSVVVITTAQLHSTKPELRFCAALNPPGGMSKRSGAGNKA